jgi:hypothetical protein
MAIVVAVLPPLPVSKFDAAPRSRVAIENLDPYRSTEPDGPRRPPRPPRHSLAARGHEPRHGGVICTGFCNATPIPGSGYGPEVRAVWDV